MDLISVHVPKTAGTSFRMVLGRVYGPDQIALDYRDVPMDPNAPFNRDPEAWRQSTRALVEGLRPDCRVIHGHFSVTKYRGMFPGARRIAWVRHPVSWMISLYFYWKSVPRTENTFQQRLLDEGLSLAEFVECPEARNRMTRAFLGGVDLADFDFVGVQEYFGDDLRALCRRLGWPAPEAVFENANPAEGYRAEVARIRGDRRFLRRLEALNPEDMRLYERALRLRRRRLRADRRTIFYRRVFAGGIAAIK